MQETQILQYYDELTKLNKELDSANELVENYKIKKKEGLGKLLNAQDEFLDLYEYSKKFCSFDYNTFSDHYHALKKSKFARKKQIKDFFKQFILNFQIKNGELYEYTVEFSEKILLADLVKDCLGANVLNQEDRIIMRQIETISFQDRIQYFVTKLSRWYSVENMSELLQSIMTKDGYDRSILFALKNAGEDFQQINDYRTFIFTRLMLTFCYFYYRKYEHAHWTELPHEHGLFSFCGERKLYEGYPYQFLTLETSTYFIETYNNLDSRHTLLNDIPDLCDFLHTYRLDQSLRWYFRGVLGKLKILYDPEKGYELPVYIGKFNGDFDIYLEFKQVEQELKSITDLVYHGIYGTDLEKYWEQYHLDTREKERFLDYRSALLCLKGSPVSNVLCDPQYDSMRQKMKDCVYISIITRFGIEYSSKQGTDYVIPEKTIREIRDDFYDVRNGGFPSDLIFDIDMLEGLILNNYRKVHDVFEDFGD